MTEDDTFLALQRPPYKEMVATMNSKYWPDNRDYVKFLSANGWKLTEFANADIYHNSGLYGKRSITEDWSKFIWHVRSAGIEYE